MGSGFLEFSQGEIHLDDDLLPGILKELRVSGNIQFDDGDVDARSGKNRTNMGWEDADITAVVELLSDEASDCYEKLQWLSMPFLAMDPQGNPKIYQVLNEHLIKRCIFDVIFAGLESRETDDDEIIEATLRFVEHEPYACQFEPGGASDSARISVSVPTLDSTVLGGVS